MEKILKGQALEAIRDFVNGIKDNLESEIDTKVDKVEGYALSKNDFTDALKNKLDNIAANAQVNIIEGIQIDGSDLALTGKKANFKINAQVTPDAINKKFVITITLLDGNNSDVVKQTKTLDLNYSTLQDALFDVTTVTVDED